jgi:hypothetical protein
LGIGSRSPDLVKDGAPADRWMVRRFISSRDRLRFRLRVEAHMTSSSRPSRRPVQRDQAGFTIVAILIIIGMMAALAATYSRHVIVYALASEVSDASLEARELIDSQLEFVLQSQRVGVEVVSGKVVEAMVDGWVGAGEHVMAGRTSMSMQSMKTAGSAHDDRSSMLVHVEFPNGMGATHLIETARAPALIATHPDNLPIIENELRIELMNDSSIPKTYFSSNTLVQDTELTGLVIVNSGVVLTLDNVIVRGAVLSGGAAGGGTLGDFSEFLAPQLVIQGNARIISESFLGGLAVLMPEGSITANGSDARLQVQGDVLAYTVSLDCPGAVIGNVASVDAAVMHTDMQRVGHGREPQDWSPVLDHHDAWNTEFVAFLPRTVTVDDLSAITSYTLPGSVVEAPP